MASRYGKDEYKLRNTTPGGYPISNSKRRCSDDLIAEGSQFFGERIDLPQSLSDDEGDDWAGPDIANGEVFRSKFERVVSENPWQHPYQECEAVKATLTAITSSSQNPTLSPSARVYIKAFFTRHSIILAIILLVTVSIAAGAVASIVAGIVAGFRRRCLAIGFGVAAGSFVLITALFALLWRREKRMKAKEKGKLKAAMTEEARKTSVNSAFMV